MPRIQAAVRSQFVQLAGKVGLGCVFQRFVQLPADVVAGVEDGCFFVLFAFEVDGGEVGSGRDIVGVFLLVGRW